MRVVLDTNVLVSSILRVDTPPASIRNAWLNAAFELIISNTLLKELQSVLDRPKIRKNVRWSAGESERLLAAIEQNAMFVTPSQKISIVAADPSDNRVLEAALTGHADYIVTGDQHLLELGNFEGIEIVTPARFVAVLVEQEM
jgi:putative PIN family toxin of toxin-antitoxin system